MRNPTQTSFSIGLIAIAVASLMAACGGGDKAEDGVMQFVAQMAAQTPPQSRAYALKADIESTLPIGHQAIGATASTTNPALVTATMVLDWAQYKCPDLFPKALAQNFPAVVYEGVLYNARAYDSPSGIRYLGITVDGRIFGLGDFTNQALRQFDTVRFWATQVVSDRCGVSPSSCAASGPVGPLNDCTLPASQALAVGNRFIASYVVSGSATGNLSIDSTVKGNTTFQGQSAVQIDTRIEGNSTIQGQTVRSVTESSQFAQDAGNGFTRNVGSTSKVTTTGLSSSSSSSFSSAYNPGRPNYEYSIQPGQSITLATTLISTFSGSTSPGPSTSSTYNFVARENITVQGKAYATCRYTVRDSNDASSLVTSWEVIGKGIEVRIESSTTAGGVTTTEVQELVSGFINGVPI